MSENLVAGPAMALSLATMTAAGALLPATASANTITIQSNGSTLAGATALNDPALATGDTTGVTFGPDLEGSFGTFTPVPPGAPAGTEVINIPPGDGESGFYLVDFTLPTGATDVSINGAANVDDEGFVFVNGNSLAFATEFGNATFSSSNPAIFNAGLNQFLVSDNNSGGGPSGAAFFATVTYAAVPEPAAWAMMLVGFAGLGAAMRSRQKLASASA